MTNRKTRYKILYLSTESKNDQAKDEYEVIQNTIQTNKNDSLVVLDHVEKINNLSLHLSIKNAHDNLLDGEKLIIQYSGHSNYFGFELEGVKPDEKSKNKVSPEKAKDFFNNFKDIEFIFFTSCDSEELANYIFDLDHIKHIIYYPDLLHDSESICFSKAFYEGLKLNNNIKEAFTFAIENLRLANKETKYFIKKPEENLFPYQPQKAISNDENLDKLIELAVSISRINETFTFDKGLYRLISNTTKKIHDLYPEFNFKLTDYEEYKESMELTIGIEILIYKLQKLLIVQYTTLVTDKIYSLKGKNFDMKYFYEKLSLLYKSLFSNDIILKEKTEAAYLQEVENIIDSFKNPIFDNEIKNIDLYIKLHEFISRTTTKDFNNIEKSISNYESNNSIRIDNITSAIRVIKQKHKELQDSFTKPLTPINFSSSWN